MSMKLSLSKLADPSSKEFTNPIVTDGFESAYFLKALKKMLLIRFAEEKIAQKIKEGAIKCPCHLAIGQEAAPVAISSFLNEGDAVFGNHRSHAHYLALGGSLYELFCEVQGRVNGCSKGMGGSQHIYAEKFGFKGSVPIVAGTVSLAVGASLAAKLSKNNSIAVTYFGDGAIEEGSVHECMNFASAYKLPILFVCENNLFSSHLHVDIRQPANSMARFACSHLIKNAVVDGNDVNSIGLKIQEFIKDLRSHSGPAFLEVVTYRWYGHVGPHDDIDVGLKRNDQLQFWKKRDPIERLAKGLESDRLLSKENFIKLETTVKAEVDTIWEESTQSPFPDSNQLLDCVYAKAGGL